MKKFTFLSTAMLATAALFGTGSALADVAYTGVEPPQGWIDLDGRSMTGYPLGVTQIFLSFPSVPQVTNDGTDRYIEIFIDGSDTPAERLLAKSPNLFIDSMGLPKGGIQFRHTFTEKGEYKIVIPAGVFTVNGEPSAAAELNYEITRDYVTIPAQGVVESIPEIEVIFPSAFKSEYVGGIDMRKAPGTDISVTVEKIEPEIEGEEQNRWRIKPNSTLTEPGEYYIVFEPGAFNLTWYGPEFSKDPSLTRDVKSDYMQLSWIIPEIATPTVDPADGSKVSEIQTITLTPQAADMEGVSFWMVDNMTKNYLYSADQDWNIDLPVATFKAAKSADGNAVVLTLDEPVTEPGNYIVKCAQGLFSISGNSFRNSAPYSFRYVVAADPTVMVNLTAEGEYDELATVELNFPNATYVIPSETVKPVLKDEAGNVLSNTITIDSNDPAPLADGEISGPTMVLTIDPVIVEKGNYTLELPAGAFSCDEVNSVAASFTYGVTGNKNSIDGIEAAEVNADVYTLTGIRVLRNADAEAISALAKGIYVVNGRKVIVK